MSTIERRARLWRGRWNKVGAQTTDLNRELGHSLQEAEARAQKANLQILDEVRAKNEALDDRDRYREAIEAAIVSDDSYGYMHMITLGILEGALSDKEAEK